MTSFPSAQAVTPNHAGQTAINSTAAADEPADSASAGSGSGVGPLSVALIRRAQAGDRAAFEQLVRATARLVYARLYPDIGDRDQTEDLVQETYLTAWRSIAQLREVPDASAFRRWLLTIARTTRIDASRRSTRKKRTATALAQDAAAHAVDVSTQPDEIALRRERHDRALGLLRSLPEEYRLPLSMRYLAGADHADICRQLGVSAGSLRGLLHRGMARLRALFQAADE